MRKIKLKLGENMFIQWLKDEITDYKTLKPNERKNMHTFFIVCFTCVVLLCIAGAMCGGDPICV